MAPSPLSCGGGLQKKSHGASKKMRKTTHTDDEPIQKENLKWQTNLEIKFGLETLVAVFFVV